MFYIPAGQIHTIGAGNLLVEIQQPSDITYRVWDYNRRDADGNLRQLHVQEAREALDFTSREGQVLDMPQLDNGMTQLVSCDHFDVQLLEVDGSHTMQLPTAHSFVAMVCIQGETTLRVEGMSPVTLQQGETALIPAVADSIEMVGSAKFLICTIPAIEDGNKCS